MKYLDFRRTALVIGWLAALLVTVVAGTALRSIRPDNSMSAWFADESEPLQAYQSFIEHYGSDNLLLVAFARPDGFVTASGMRRVDELSQALGDLPFIARATSFLDVIRREEASSSMLGRESFSRLADPGQRLAFLRGHAVLAQRFIDASGTFTVIVCQLRMSAKLDFQQADLRHNIKAALAEYPEQNFIAGPAVVYGTLNDLSRAEMEKLFGLCIAIMSIVLIILFGSYRPVVLGLATSLVATIWAMGFLSLLRGSFNAMTGIVPAVTVIVGMTTACHVYGQLRSRKDVTLKHVLVPCSYALLTTAAGFGSLQVATLALVRDLGLTLGVAVVSLWLLTILVLHSVPLNLLRGANFERRNIASVHAERFASALTRAGLRYPKTVSAAFLGGMGIFLVAATQVEVNSVPLALFPDDHPVKQDIAMLESRIGPATNLELVVETSGPLLDPSSIRVLHRFVQDAEEIPLVHESSSFLTLVERLHQLLRNPGDTSALPESDIDLQRIATLLQFGAAESLGWDLDGQSARLTFFIYGQTALEFQATLDRIVQLAQRFPQLHLRPAGMLPMFLNQIERMVSSQLQSLGVAMLIIFGLLFWMLKSPRLLGVAIASNVFPVVVIVGLMGMLAIPMDLGTVAIASVVMGLVVDDTIHILHGVREQLGSSSIEESFRKVARSIGFAVVGSSVAIAVGFSVLGFAQIKMIMRFGLLLGVAAGAALLADLMWVPALVLLCNKKAVSASSRA